MKETKIRNKKISMSSENNIKLPLIKLNNARKSAEIITNQEKIKEGKITIMNENQNNKNNNEETNKNKENQNDMKISNIISDINKNHNIFSKIITEAKEKVSFNQLNITNIENNDINQNNHIKIKNINNKNNNITKSNINNNMTSNTININNNINNKNSNNIDTNNEKNNINNQNNSVNNSINNIIINKNNNNIIINNKPKPNFKRKYHYYLIPNKNNKSEIEKPKETIFIPKITKEKLVELKEKRRKRIIQEKKEKELLSKMMEDLKKEKNTKKELLFNSNNNIKISGEKILSMLHESGIIDAYKYLINKLHTDGIPPRNLFLYSSEIIKEFEKNWKEKKIKTKVDNIDKYFDDKKKDYIKNLDDENQKNNNSLIYKVLKEREDNQFIKKLDRSRSSLHIIKKDISLIKSKEKDLSFEAQGKKFKKIRLRKKINFKIKGFETTKNNPKNISEINNIKDEIIEPKLYFKISLKNNEEMPSEQNNNKKSVSNEKILNINKSSNIDLRKNKGNFININNNNKINKSINLKNH